MENSSDNENVKKETAHRFTKKDNTVRFFVIILLGAFSYALSLFGKIPGMQIRGIFPIEPSDAVIFLAYALYGFWASIAVALLKTGLLMVTFLSKVTLPIPMEGITNFTTSFFLAFGILIMDRSFRTFHRGIGYRLLGYLFLTAFVSLSMVSLVYAFVIPTALNNYHWATIYQTDIAKMMEEHAAFFPYPDSYALSVIRVYMPYVGVKTYSICLIYEIFFHQYVYRVLKSGLLENHFFYNRYDFELRKCYIGLREEALKDFRLKDIKERKLEMLKRRNARKALKEGDEEKKAAIGITQYDYQFDMTVDDYGSIHQVSIVTDSDSPQIILNYMKNSHPGSCFSIASYKEGAIITRDASSDGLSEELFRQVNGYDREETKIIEVSIIIRNQKTRKAIS